MGKILDNMIQDCIKCEMHSYIQLYDDYDENCEIYRNMFVPCYLPRILRKIYKKILIPYYDWRAGRKIIKEEKQRIKLGYSEEEWVEIKSKNLKLKRRE
jgi:hypothetical protein